MLCPTAGSVKRSGGRILRRTLGSWQTRASASLSFIGKSLGHKSQQATAIDADFYTWTQQQADHLRAGRLDALDALHLIEELESMGAREWRELETRL